MLTKTNNAINRLTTLIKTSIIYLCFFTIFKIKIYSYRRKENKIWRLSYMGDI